MNIKKIASQFPLIMSGRKSKLIYFDSAATSQKPKLVIDTETLWYSQYNANVHRGLYPLSENATKYYEQSRAKIGKFIGAKSAKNIVFTRGATEGINLVAYAWARENLHKGDTIVVSQMEHHANLVPWQMLAQEKGLRLAFWPITREGKLDMSYLKRLPAKTRLIAVAHASNVLGTINPISKIVQFAHDKNIAVLVDACQSAPHLTLNMRQMKPDFLVFSAHKMFGPTGVGVLYVDEARYPEMSVYQTGGDMIESVSFEKTMFAQAPQKFEAGTQALAQIYAFGKAVDFIEKFGHKEIQKIESLLVKYAYKSLLEIPEVRIIGPIASERVSLISFVVENLHAHDLAQWLAKYNIAIRAGHHCAQPLHDVLKIESTARVSFSIYNTQEEIDFFIKTLKEIISLWKDSTEKK